MGVRGLTKFFLERAPAAFQQINLSMFRHEKIAFDGANILYAARRNGDDHIASLGTFFRRLVSEYDVHPVVVFDGSFPTWKRRETQLDRSHQEHELARLRRLHLRYSADTERTPCDRITLRIKQLLDRQIRLTPTDFTDTIDVLRELKIPYLYAAQEAETLCFDLWQEGKVAAVVSDDSDLLVLGVGRLIVQVCQRTLDATCITVSTALAALAITPEQLVNMALLFGTDCNARVFPKHTPWHMLRLVQTVPLDQIVTCPKQHLELLKLREKFLRVDREPFTMRIPYSGVPRA
jgi:5'-3' exonuclease